MQRGSSPWSRLRKSSRATERPCTGPNLPLQTERMWVLHTAQGSTQESTPHAKNRGSNYGWLCICLMYGQPIPIPSLQIHKKANHEDTRGQGRNQHYCPPASHHPRHRTVGIWVRKSMQKSKRCCKATERYVLNWHSSNWLFLTNRLPWLAEGSNGSHA